LMKRKPKAKLMLEKGAAMWIWSPRTADSVPTI
jgi:hypothetical protein